NATSIDFANPAFAFVAAVKKAQSLDQKKIAEALQTVEFENLWGTAHFGGKEYYGIGNQILYPMPFSEVRDGVANLVVQLSPPHNYSLSTLASLATRHALRRITRPMTPALLLQSAIIGVSIGSIYILMALGLTLMFGMMHIINFAHGAVYMLGAFVIYYVFFQGGVPYFAALVLAMILLGVFGYLVERSVYRPIKGGIEPTLVALLALTTFLQAAGYPVFGQLDKHVPPVFSGTRNVLGVMISVERLMIIPVAGVLVAGLYLFINRTRLGAAMRAIEQDKEAAALQGVNVHVVNGLAFAIGFALAAAAGALMAPIFKLDPMMGEQPLLKAFI